MRMKPTAQVQHHSLQVRPPHNPPGYHLISPVNSHWFFHPLNRPQIQVVNHPKIRQINLQFIQHHNRQCHPQTNQPRFLHHSQFQDQVLDQACSHPEVLRTSQAVGLPLNHHHCHHNSRRPNLHASPPDNQVDPPPYNPAADHLLSRARTHRLSRAASLR